MTNKQKNRDPATVL